MRRRPPRRRIARRDELRRHLGCRAERGIVEDGQIFFDGTAGRIRRQAGTTLDAVAVAGIGMDQTGVDGKPFAAHQPLGNAALQYALEQTPQQVAVTKPAMAVLREGRVIRHRALKSQPAKPSVGEVQVHLLAQPPLRADAEAVADNQARSNETPGFDT